MSGDGHRPANLAASVRARLQNLARERGVEFQLALSDFAAERFLYRLGASPHAASFVLKGAMLFKLWPETRSRATWDLDLLGRGASGVRDVLTVVGELCTIQAEDGIEFDPTSVTGEEIRPADDYGGIRARFEARLAEARIPMQLDVGFGDAVTPAPIRESYPTLLGHDPPEILVYPRETVVAEKLEAMVSLGMTNSRMKDFYDVHVLATHFAFRGTALAEAISATFKRRGTPIPSAEPLALTRAFFDAPERETQWRAFLRRGRLEGPPRGAQLGEALRLFLWPVLCAIARGAAFPAFWPPGGPWTSGPE